jgi:pimeloyl-ACP methyl ester carboxylesterase
VTDGGGAVPGAAGPRVRVARSRGYAISFEDAGSGPVLILVNGYGGLASEWRDLGYVDRLTPARRVLSVDPLGHGLSDAPHDADAYRFPDVAADIVAVLDAAGIDRAALWGYSRGAWLACTAAVEFPERVTSLVLGGCAFDEPPSGEAPASVEALSRGDWEASWSALPFEVSDHDRALMESNDPRALAAVDIGSRRSAYLPDLGRLAVPTLLYVGGGDDPDLARPTATALGVDLQVVGQGDHFGTFTDVDAIVPLVTAHLGTT